MTLGSAGLTARATVYRNSIEMRFVRRAYSKRESPDQPVTPTLWLRYFLAGAFEGAAELVVLVELDEAAVFFFACFLCFFTFVPGAAGEVVGSAGVLDFGAGVWV